MGSESDKYKKRGHIEVYNGKRIIVGKVYDVSGTPLTRACCVEYASPELLVVEHQTGHPANRQGRKNIVEFVKKLVPLSTGACKTREGQLRKQSDWLYSKVKSSRGL